MKHRLAVTVLVAALSAGVWSKSSFITPPPPGPAGNYQDNPTHKEGQKLKFQWVSDLESTDLSIWQEYPTPPDDKGAVYYQHYQPLLEGTKDTNFTWTVSLDRFLRNISKGEDAILYLALYDPKTNARDATCHYFNVTIASAMVSPSVSTTVSTGAASSTLTPTATSTTVLPETSSSGLSKGATAGIAVGAIIGGLLLIGGLGFLAWRCLRGRREHVREPVAVQQVVMDGPELAGSACEAYREGGKHTQNYWPQPICEAPSEKT